MQNLGSSLEVKFETGRGARSAKRDRKEAGPSRLVDGSFNKQRKLLPRLVLGTIIQIDRCTSGQNLKGLRRGPNLFSHVYCPDSNSKHIALSACILEMAPTIGTVGGMCAPKDRGRAEGPPIALVRSPVKPAVTSSPRAPPSMCHWHPTACWISFISARVCALFLGSGGKLPLR